MSRRAIPIKPPAPDPHATEDQGPLTNPRLEEILEAYLDDLRARVSAMHVRNVSSRLRRLLAALGADRVSDLRPAEVIRIRNQAKANGAANRTANLLTDSLRAMFTWAAEVNLIRESPLPPIRRLPESRAHQRYRRRALREDEVARFLEAAAEDDRANAGIERFAGRTRVPQLPFWIALMETGARWSELRRVRWRDVDPERRIMILRAETTKSGKVRGIPLRDELLGHITVLAGIHREVHGRQLRPEEFIFLSPEGVPWKRASTNAMRIFDRVLRRAGILKLDVDGDRLDIHALRHAFASRLARAGVGLMQAQRLLGHADPKTTAMIYAHLETNDLRSAIDVLPPLGGGRAYAAEGEPARELDGRDEKGPLSRIEAPQRGFEAPSARFLRAPQEGPGGH